MQLDFHYYATYCAAIIAGHTHEESERIAYSAQFVDCCSKTLLIKVGGPKAAATTQLQLELMDADTDPVGLQDITRIWSSFHFLPGDLDAKRVGWEDDNPDDDDYTAEIDKRMRNNGYMKGPQSIDSNNGTERGSNDRENIRHIFVRQTLDPNETYYIKLKSVLASDRKEFYMDFIEYCAKEIYDNPEKPEDIW